MPKYLKRKQIFWIISIIAFTAPFLTHGQTQTPAIVSTQWCVDYGRVEDHALTRSEALSYRDCFGTEAACVERENSIIAETGGWRGVFRGWGGYNYVTGTCQKKIQYEGDPPIPTGLISPPRTMGAGTCTIDSHFDIQTCIKIGVGYVISVILNIMSWGLWAANNVFNLAIYVSIENFSKYAGMDAITFIWKMGRDLANVFFIFILMYIAIATIIQKNSRSTKEMVVKLIITALLINFSIIIPKVIIDVGNSLAIVFYKNMGEPGMFGAPDIGTPLIKSANSYQFYSNELGVIESSSNGNVDGQVATSKNIGDLDWSVILVRGLGTAILMGFLIYVLLVVTYLFLVRTITLIVLIATSSLVFFSRVIPFPGLNYWDDWFKKLIKETFFAPAFLFMFYLVLKIATTGLPGIENASTDTNTGSINFGIATAEAQTTPPATGWGDQFFLYVLLVGLSLGSVMVARSMGTWAGKVGGQIKDKVANYGGSWVARNTAGRLSNKIANSDKMKNIAARSPMVGGALRRVIGAGANSRFGGGKDGTSFNSAQESAAKRMEVTMKGMNDAQKTRYLEKSGTFFSGEKEKNKLISEHLKDIKSTTNSIDPKTGKEISGSYDTLFRLSPDEKQRDKVLKEMSDGSIAKILVEADTKKEGAKFDKFMSGLDAERRQKIEGIKKKEAERQKKAIMSDELKTFDSSLKDGTIPEVEVAAQLAKLNGGDLEKLSGDAVAKIKINKETVSTLKPVSLIELYNHSELSEDKKLELENIFEDLISETDKKDGGVKLVDASGKPIETSGPKISKKQERVIRALIDGRSLVNSFYSKHKE